MFTTKSIFCAKELSMKPNNIPNLETPPQEPLTLRILQVSTIIMTIVMLFGFILIVSLLSIAINKSITDKTMIQFNNKFDLAQNEFLTAVTYSSKYTILLIKSDKNLQTLRIISNKTGKVMGDTLLSELIAKDSEK